MKIISLTAIILLLSLGSFGQNNLDDILAEIEKNNTTLAAFRQQLDARSLKNQTGMYLHNPEFEYAWFAGTPESLGKKTGISVRQQFDFPTAYRHRSRLSHARNEQLQWDYNELRGEVLLEARLIVLELIHTQRLQSALEKRQEHAARIADAYARMLQSGEANILEHNKAQLNLLDINNQVNRLTIEQNRLSERLAAFNGGQRLEQLPQEFPQLLLESDFEAWFKGMAERNPQLQWLQQGIEISRREEQLQRAVNLPSFNAGYVSELLTHEQFRGFAVGVSIPLWENKNTLKHAKAQTLALQSESEDQQLQYLHHLRAEYGKAINLQSTLNAYQSLLPETDNSELLLKAWQAGQIGITEYLLELSFFYQSINTLLEMEFELHKTLAELNKYNN